MDTYTIICIGHNSTYSTTDIIDARLRANILESIGYTVIMRDDFGPVAF